MSLFLLKLQKTYASETWENTYGVATGNTHTPGLTQNDLTMLGLDDYSNIGLAKTNPGSTDPVYDPATASAISTLLAFERSILSGVARITRIYLTDGLYQTTAFKSYECSLPGLWGGADNESVYAGSVALMARRNAWGVNARTGRAFYRLALKDDEVAANGFKLVGMSNPTAVNTRFSGSVTNSGMARFFSAGDLEQDVKWVIPRYESTLSPEGKKITQLKTSYFWLSWGSLDARARQVSKGRKAPVNA